MNEPQNTESRANPTVTPCYVCEFLLVTEKENFHPGGTSLRVETATPSDRCALKPKKDNFGRIHDVSRWIGSGGSPLTVAHPCSGNCPLKVHGSEYGPLIIGTCPVCKRGTIRETTEPKECLDCGTKFELVLGN